MVRKVAVAVAGALVLCGTMQPGRPVGALASAPTTHQPAPTRVALQPSVLAPPATPAGGDTQPANAQDIVIAVTASTGQTSSAARTAAAAALPSPPFNECPAAGADKSCGVLIVLESGGVDILVDPSQGPFDGADDTLVGVLNSAGGSVSSIMLAANAPVFGFDGDGLCTFGVAGCPFGPTGYEGPSTAFSNISADQTGGTVNFTQGLASGATAFFSLEVAIDASTFASFGPTQGNEQGGGSPSMPHGQPPCKGAPVNCLDGEFWHDFTDLSIPGRGLPLKFTRTYSSHAAGSDRPLGFGWTHSYNMSLAVNGAGMVTITEENGATITFAPVSGGGFTPPSRIPATLVKNADGSFTLTRLDQTHQTFSAAGQLIRQTDRNGYATTLAYTGGLLTSVTDPAGRQLTLTYTGSHVVKVTDPIGRSASFLYDSAGNLQMATDMAGGKTTFTYDANHLLLTMTDPNGGVLTNVYDASGRVVSQTDPMNRKTTFSYVPGSQTTITDPNGKVEVQQYQNNLPVSKMFGAGTPQAATWTYQYDHVSLGATSTTDGNGHQTRATYDANGNTLTTTDSLNRTTSTTYDAFNHPTSYTDSLNGTTTVAYDGSGHMLSRSQPLAGTSSIATETFTYSDLGHPGDVTAVTDAAGHTTNMSYDQYGNVVKVVDPLGNTSTSTFDVVGRQTATVSPRGNVTGASAGSFTTSFTYDAFGDRLQVTDPLSRKTSFTYDGNRNQLTTTDGNGHTSTTTYDADNEIIKQTAPDGTTNSTAYDGNGNVTSRTDALGNTTTYTYDALNRRTSATDGLGRKTMYGYDTVGNLTSIVDAQNQTATYSYDTANQLTGIAYSDGATHNVSFQYNADRQLVGMTDGSGWTCYTYDSLHRLTQETNGAGASVGYAYDIRGHLTSITYPGGAHTVARGYDAAGHVTSVADWQGNTTTFAYDADGNLVQEIYPNGTTAVFKYDDADQLMAIADTSSSGTLLSLSYMRDGVGDVTAENLNTYSYDALNRVTAAGPQNYGYDAASHITSSTDTLGNVHARTYDTADQLTQDSFSTDVAKTTNQFSYDARGDRLSWQGTTTPNGGTVSTTYSYDQADRLTGAQVFSDPNSPKPTTTAQYASNGSGLRTSKTVSTATSTTSEAFTWDEAEGMPLLLQDGSTSYVTGPNGLPLEQVASSGTVLYYHQDQLGSTRALTDAAGNVAASYRFDAYGNTLASTPAVNNPFQFAGQFQDLETGLYYLRARYYDPLFAQFLTRDPLLPETKQAYGYGSDDPVNLTDPKGLIACDNSGGQIGQFVRDHKAALQNIATVASAAAGALGLIAIGCATVAWIAAGLGELACGAAGTLALAAGTIAAVADTLLAAFAGGSWLQAALDVVALVISVARILSELRVGELAAKFASTLRSGLNAWPIRLALERMKGVAQFLGGLDNSMAMFGAAQVYIAAMKGFADESDPNDP